MARKATGQVIPPKDGRAWAIRFYAYGKRRYVALGTTAEGWDRRKAEAELRHVLADVERGVWREHESEPVEAPVEVPTFHEFASEWLAARRGELKPRTVEDYEWALTCHLLPFFARHRLDAITVEDVDRYRAAKVREGRLTPNVINKTLTRLAQVLEVAVEYGHLERNPARGRRRRLKSTMPKRAWIEPEQVAPLLDAAGAIDGERVRSDDPGGRRAMLATLTLAGLRIGELLALRWRDVDLASGKLRVGEAKTDAGRRTVDLSPALRDELGVHKAGARRAEPESLVFGTRSGKAQNRNNVRRRVLLAAVERANGALEDAGEEALPEGLSPHALRHTFASLLVLSGADPAYVMAQLGHTDPKFTLRVYAHALRRQHDHGERLDALVSGIDWAATGSGGRLEAPDPAALIGVEHEKTPR